MMIKITYFLILMFAPALMSAQESLSWSRCAEIALENNHSLKVKKAAVEESRRRYLAGINEFLPQISISHSFSRSGGDDANPSSRWSVGISADENLLNFRAIASVKTNRLFWEKMLEDYKTESASIRHNLHLAYVNLVFGQEKVKAENKILKIRENNAKLIKLKYDSGMESRGNAMYSTALWELAKTNLAKAQRTLLNAGKELSQQMGVENDGINAADGGLVLPDIEFDKAEAKKLLEKIPAVASRKKNAEIYRQRLLSARSDLYPNISASQSLSWSGDREFPSDKNWSLGLSLRIPLFSGGITYYRHNVGAAKSGLRAVEEELNNLITSTEKDIIAAYNDFLNAADSARANIAVLKANEERYNEAKIKYMAGKINFIDLSNIEQSLVDSELNQLEYVRNAISKKTAFEKLLGRTLEEVL